MKGARQRPRRRMRHDWVDTLLRPHVLLAVVALAAAVPYLARGLVARPVDVALPPLVEGGAERTISFEAPLVLVGLDGVSSSAMVAVTSAEHEASRLRSTLAALREALVDEGVWPPGVGPPDAASFDADRRRVVVVDVIVEGSVAVTVSQELAAYRSMVETMRAAGADEVRMIVNGEPASTLWGHVALP